MAIFHFFKMASAAILDFSNFKFLMIGQGQGASEVPKIALESHSREVDHQSRMGLIFIN